MSTTSIVEFQTFYAVELKEVTAYNPKFTL